MHKRGPDSQPFPLLLSARESAALCGVSPATWWRWQAAGRLPAPVRPSPGTVRWIREDVVAWINDGCPPRGRPSS